MLIGTFVVHLDLLKAGLSLHEAQIYSQMWMPADSNIKFVTDKEKFVHKNIFCSHISCSGLHESAEY